MRVHVAELLERETGVVGGAASDHLAATGALGVRRPEPVNDDCSLEEVVLERPRPRPRILTGFGRRSNPVFSDEYGAIRAVLVCARVNAGVSQRELAKRLGKAHSHVARVESGERRVDALELWEIANCLRLDARELFARIVLQLEAIASDER